MDNIWIGNPKATKEEVTEAAKQVGIEALLDRTISSDKQDLSGGERQKIAMARALLRDTAINIFDESSSNMDVVSEHNFMRIISEYLAEKTVIVISHNKMFREFANKVYKIEGGRLLSC